MRLDKNEADFWTYLNVALFLKELRDACIKRGVTNINIAEPKGEDPKFFDHDFVFQIVLWLKSDDKSLQMENIVFYRIFDTPD